VHTDVYGSTLDAKVTRFVLMWSAIMVCVPLRGVPSFARCGLIAKLTRPCCRWPLCTCPSQTSSWRPTRAQVCPHGSPAVHFMATGTLTAGTSRAGGAFHFDLEVAKYYLEWSNWVCLAADLQGRACLVADS
jgi:hypothetical protein